MSKVIIITDDFYVPIANKGWIVHRCMPEPEFFQSWPNSEYNILLIKDGPDRDVQAIYCNSCDFVLTDYEVLEKYNFLLQDQPPYPIPE